MQIEVKNLTHIYSEGFSFETAALSDISFEIRQGEFVSVIGHTGSGKSSLVQHLNGLLKPSSGTVTANGINLSEKTKEAMAIRHKIGMVFQYPEYQLFEETVLKDVCFGPENMGLSGEEALALAKKALITVGIDPDKKGASSPFSLSGGQKRRVAIAGVIAMQPEVLILDEPTAGLDPKGREDILKMINRIKEDTNMTIIFITHNMDDAARLSDRVMVLDKGRLVMFDTPEKIFERERELNAIGLGIPRPMSFGNKLGLHALTIDELTQKILQKYT